LWTANATAYLDVILVFSRSLEAYEQHVQVLFDRLQRYGVLIHPSKRVFRAPQVTFLGYKVSAEGSQPLEERVTIYRTANLSIPPVSSAVTRAC
jgi:hypothetical protein